MVRVYFSDDGNTAHEAFWSDEEPKENVGIVDDIRCARKHREQNGAFASALYC